MTDPDQEMRRLAAVELGQSYLSGSFDRYFKTSVEIAKNVEDPEIMFLKQFIALSDPHSRHRAQVRKPDYLLRLYRESGETNAHIKHYRDALTILNNLSDLSISIHKRLDDIAQFVASPWLGSVEHRLHFLIATMNTLEGIGRDKEAEAVLREYQKLSLALSSGKARDVLLLSSYHKQLIEIGNRLDRKRLSVLGVSTKVGKHALKSMAERWRGGVQQAQESRAKMQETLSQIFLQEFQKNRGFWQKFYQLGWGMWADIPDNVRANLENALYSSYVVSDEKIKAMVSESLGKPRDTIFSEWNSVPIGSGSFAQVHRARLKSGEEVAVKVQYPDAEKNVKADMKTLKNLTTIMEAMYPGVHMKGITDTIKMLIKTELDYKNELKMMKNMVGVLYDRPEINIPNAYDELCTNRVITMDFLSGVTGREFCQYATQEERNRMAELIIYAGKAPMVRNDEYIFEFHLGNFVFQDGKLGMTDFGSTTPVVVQGIRSFFDSLYWIMTGDYESFGNSYVTTGIADSRDSFDLDAEVMAHKKYLFAPYLTDGLTLYDFHTSLKMFEYQSKTSPNVGKVRLAPVTFALMKYFWTHASTLGALRPCINFRQVIDPLWNEYLSLREESEKSSA